MAEIIEIKKEKIPYKFKIKFSNGVFEFRIRYNKNSDTFLMDLYNSDGEEIAKDELLVLFMPLFWIYQEDIKGNLNPNFPDKYIIPVSNDGTEKAVNLNNISESVFLKLQDRGTQEIIFEY